MTRAHLLVSILPFALAACGSDNGAGPKNPDAAAVVDSGVSAACPRDDAAADRERFVVVAHPNSADGGEATSFEVLALSAAGELSPTGHSFELGFRAPRGTIAFSPDGEVGVVPLGDGSLGVFTLAADGTPTVVHEQLAGDFYASSVRVSPSGDRVLVLDSQFRENGGGIYSFAIGCDGALAAEGQVAGAKLAADLLWLDGTRAVVPADDFLDSPMNLDLHLVDLAAEPSWVTGIAVFGGTESIVGSAALTSSGRYALIGDTCGFCTEPNRIGIAEVAGESLTARQVIEPFEDPYHLVASPFDDRVLAISGFGDAMFELAPTGDPQQPYAAPAELTYAGARPQLPGNAVMIDRGSLRGLVLVPENTAVRRVRFHDGAAIEDLGPFSLGSGTAAIAGAIGVQP